MYDYIYVYSVYFGGSPSEETAKTDNSKKIKLLYSSIMNYIRRLTDECVVPHVRPVPWPQRPIYLSVNRQIYDKFVDFVGTDE
jgi:hypothetical protein